MKDAVFENEATMSDFEVAPTLIAEEIHPGELRAFVKPLFPAATTVAIPTDRRLSMIGFTGSPSQGVVDEASTQTEVCRREATGAAESVYAFQSGDDVRSPGQEAWRRAATVRGVGEPREDL